MLGRKTREWAVVNLKRVAWSPRMDSCALGAGKCYGCSTHFRDIGAYRIMSKHPKSCQLRRAVAWVKSKGA